MAGPIIAGIVGLALIALLVVGIVRRSNQLDHVKQAHRGDRASAPTSESPPVGPGAEGLSKSPAEPSIIKVQDGLFFTMLA